MTETTRRLRAMILDKHSGHGRPFPLDRRRLAEHRPDIGGENAIRHSIDVLIQAGEIRALPRRHIRAATMYEIVGETPTHPQPTHNPPVKKEPTPGYCPQDNIRGVGHSGGSDELGDGIPDEDAWMYGDADWQMDRPKPKRRKRVVKIDWSRVEIDRAVVARYSPKIECTPKLGTQADREAITRRIRAELSPIEHSDPVAVIAQADDRLVKLRADNRPVTLSRELFDKFFARNDKPIPAHIIPPAPEPIFRYGYWHFANLDEAITNRDEIDAHRRLAEARTVWDVLAPAALDRDVAPPASAAPEASELWQVYYDRVVGQSEPIETYLARMEAAGSLAAHQDTGDAHGSVMRDGGERSGVGLASHVPDLPHQDMFSQNITPGVEQTIGQDRDACRIELNDFGWRDDILATGLLVVGIDSAADTAGLNRAEPDVALTNLVEGACTCTRGRGMLDPADVPPFASETTERQSADLEHATCDDGGRPPQTLRGNRGEPEQAQQSPLAEKQGQKPFACKYRVKVGQGVAVLNSRNIVNCYQEESFAIEKPGVSHADVQLERAA